MNYHYIEFMIKEQKRLELEYCERKRRLRKASEPNNGYPENKKAAVLKDIFLRVRTILMRNQNVSETTLCISTHLEAGRKI